MKNLTLSLIALLTSVSVSAATLQPATKIKSPFIFGLPSNGGNGCPAGGISIQLEKSGRVTVELAMDVRGDVAHASFSRLACSLRIPMNVAKNYKIVVREINNKGNYFLEPQDIVSVSQKVSIVGGPALNNPDLSLSGQGDIAWKNAVAGKNLAESVCNTRSLMLGVNTNMLLKKLGALSSNSYASLEQVQFQILAVKCK